MARARPSPRAAVRAGGGSRQYWRAHTSPPGSHGCKHTGDSHRTLNNSRSGCSSSHGESRAIAAAQATREPAGRAGKADATTVRALLSGTRGCCARAHRFNVMQGGSGQAACTRDEHRGEASMSLQVRNTTPRGVQTGHRTRRRKMTNPWLLKPKVTEDFAPYEVISDAKGERKTHRAA